MADPFADLDSVAPAPAMAAQDPFADLDSQQPKPSAGQRVAGGVMSYLNGGAKIVPLAEKVGGAIMGAPGEISGAYHGDPEEISNAYNNARDDYKTGNDYLMKNYPNQNAAGYVAGTLLTAGAYGPPGIGSLAKMGYSQAVSDSDKSAISDPAGLAEDAIVKGTANTIAGHYIGMAGGKLLKIGAQTKAAQAIRDVYGHLLPSLQNAIDKATYEGADNVPIAALEKSGNMATSAAQLAKSPKLNKEMADATNYATANLDNFNQSKIQPLYNSVNETPLPAAKMGLEGNPYQDLLEKNPAIAQAIKTVKTNMGQNAPTDTMSLLKYARDELKGKALGDARQTLTNFMSENGAPQIQSADSLHKYYLGTKGYGESPATNLRVIQGGVDAGQGKVANDLIANVGEKTGPTAIIGKAIQTGKQLIEGTPGVPEAFKTKGMDKKSLAALSDILMNPDANAAMTQIQKNPVIRQNIVKFLPYLGINATNSLLNPRTQGTVTPPNTPEWQRYFRNNQ